MSIERWIRLIAGTFIIVSVALSYFQSRLWLWFTLFVGVNLFQSALTRWCLMEDILRKLGVGREAVTAGSSSPRADATP
jgi:Inner membrane protein YgaP-like, transmembrane domain